MTLAPPTPLDTERREGRKRDAKEEEEEEEKQKQKLNCSDPSEL